MTRELRLKFIAESLPTERLIVDELKSLGYELNNIDTDLKNYYYLKQDVVNVLLAWIDKTSNPVLIETLVRHLAATKVKYDGSILAKVFDKLDVEFTSEKWAIANTMACTKAMHIDSWVEHAILNPKHSIARQMLCDVVVKNLPKKKAIVLLEEVFADLPIHASLALAKIGGYGEFTFLENSVQKLPEGNAK